MVDKLEKLPREAIEKEMGDLGLDTTVIDQILQTLSLRSLAELESVLDHEDPSVVELRTLFSLADDYGFGDWLQFDASLVRGLAYYTGTVFEAFDRKVNLRAVCGGGRYDHLLSTFGGEDMPAVGFGFGDVVILELLGDLKKRPSLEAHVDDVVFAFEEPLRGVAAQVAARLRGKGRSVDMILEPKKLKWVLKHAVRLGASRVLFVAPEEWQSGLVNVRDLTKGSDETLRFDQL